MKYEDFNLNANIDINMFLKDTSSIKVIPMSNKNYRLKRFMIRYDVNLISIIHNAIALIQKAI